MPVECFPQFLNTLLNDETQLIFRPQKINGKRTEAATEQIFFDLTGSGSAAYEWEKYFFATTLKDYKCSRFANLCQQNKVPVDLEKAKNILNSELGKRAAVVKEQLRLEKSDNNRACGFPLAKPTGLFDAAGDSSQSTKSGIRGDVGLDFCGRLGCGETLSNGGRTKNAGSPRKGKLAILGLALSLSSAITWAGWAILKKRFSGGKRQQKRGPSTKKTNSSTTTQGAASSSRKKCEGGVSTRLQRGNRQAAKIDGPGDAQHLKDEGNLQSNLRD
eukprot:GHVT01024614.1.p1 GENE.GHVT01024614.1~~GHVT01024614.1.p1  ORF type:complete len:274 (+),score=46.20 GHVT01024614.1:1617-2438(+)